MAISPDPQASDLGFCHGECDDLAIKQQSPRSGVQGPCGGLLGLMIL